MRGSLARSVIGEAMGPHEPELVSGALHEHRQPAEPLGIGATAHIREVEDLEEGRLNIMRVGGQRFVLRQITSRTPNAGGLHGPQSPPAPALRSVSRLAGFW